MGGESPGLITLLNKYYVDELYDLLWVEPTKKLGLGSTGSTVSSSTGWSVAVAQMAEWVRQDRHGRKVRHLGGLNVVGYGNHLAGPPVATTSKRDGSSLCCGHRRRDFLAGSHHPTHHAA